MKYIIVLLSLFSLLACQPPKGKKNDADPSVGSRRSGGKLV